MKTFGQATKIGSNKMASADRSRIWPRQLRAGLCTGTSVVTRSILGAAALAAAPLLTLVAPEIAYAQASVPLTVGETVIDPVTGERLTVISIFEGAVLTEDYRLFLSNPAVGAQVPDPADASSFVEVTAVTVNPGTGLVDTVTLADGRTIDVARDVSGQIVRGEPDSGSAIAATRLPEANQNSNTVFIPRDSANGANGANASLFDSADAGRAGSTLGVGTRVSSAAIEANGISFQSRTIRNSGIRVSASGGDGGDGGDGAGFAGFTRAGANGGAGGTGPAFTMTNSGTVSVSRNGLFGMIVLSQGGDGGNGGDGAFGFTSNAGNGGRAGAGGNVRADNAVGGNISTYGISGHGIYVLSLAGRGGSGGDADLAFDSDAGNAGAGANGGAARATNLGAIFTVGRNAHGILGQSIGGTGGSGGDASGLVAFAGSASAGGSGGIVELENRGLISTIGAGSVGMLAQSIGGGGGDSGNSGGLVAIGASGGAGSNGGTISTSNRDGTISTRGERAYGVLAQSIGGGGGSGGTAGGAVAIGSSGAGGGSGGSVEFLNNFGLISTTGVGAHGVLTQSIGGGGGTGGSSGGVVALGGSGGSGGSGSRSSVTNRGTILTSGREARGIIVQSIGGGGGDGASAGGPVSLGGAGSGAGNGGQASALSSRSLVRTTGLSADAIVVQSIGGGGGTGGSSGGLVSIGGSGARAGNGGSANAASFGRVETVGDFARGILVQSIGGGGGSGGSSGGLVAIGGSSSRAGSGSTAIIENRGAVTTAGNFANSLHAQSIGGGGGTGGSSGGVTVVIGGQGGGGGSAGAVQVTNSGLIDTGGDFSNGIFAQSVGGGGGDGGNANSGSAFVGVSVGGTGSGGGSGGTVTVTSANQEESIDGVTRSLLPLVRTAGDFSNGIFAQSVGGGGGSGGSAVQATAGLFGGVSVAVGGLGAGGGGGGTVNILGDSVILTDGNFAHGTLAQSVGGGGGNGGSAVSVAVAAGPGAGGSVSVGVGGSGGGGGAGGRVNLAAGGFTGTSGAFSHGILAQSVGGGGGNGGFAVSIAAAASDSVAVAIPVGVGGSGGSGGTGGIVDLDYDGNLLAEGAFSHALLAQSVGGGGGNGGFNVSGAIAAAGAAAGSVAVGVGGTGGGGGNGGLVDTAVTGDVQTTGNFATALVTQSVGGSGGTGGYNVAGSITASGVGAGAVSVGVGGSGGGAGAGGQATSLLTGNLLTIGDFSRGILTQSVGGGGGNGGLNVSGSIAGSGTGAGGISVGIGGAGGAGGAGGTVSATVVGDLETRGSGANALVAQSLGGGGGNGALNVSGSISGAGTGAGAISVGVGGSGGTAGTGGSVTARVTGTTITRSSDADAIVAQSVGGSGGNGGINVSGALTLTSAGGNVGVGVGGVGGSGGAGGRTDLTVNGPTTTLGDDSIGILAQSLGGGGGNGGLNVGAGISLSTGLSGTIAVGVGGKGGGGGGGGNTFLTVAQNTATTGDRSAAIIAQSLGGGGGNGGINVSGAIAASTAGTGGLAVGVGGFGGSGGAGSMASATIEGFVSTAGKESAGILVQSLGGGGGNGSLNVAAGVALSSSTAVGGSIGVGGFGGTGGNGGTATLSGTGETMTAGAASNAITVQSIGGGGGNGGTNIAGGVTFGGTGSFAGAIGIGGFGASAGNGGAVNAIISGESVASGFDTTADPFSLGPFGDLIDFAPAGSHGVFAQSVGGSGGSGGINISGGIALGGTGAKSLALGLGGFGSGGGNGGQVTAHAHGPQFAGAGDGKSAIFAQSLGGGGGDGALNISGGISMNGTLSVGVGGFGAAGGMGGAVSVISSGALNARGIQASGLRAQSIGGGGGNGGTNISGGIGLGTGSTFPAVAFGLGGTGGDGSAAALVSASHSGIISVVGVGATGIDAQSVGGGGGTGGFNVAAAVGGSKSFSLGIGVGGSGGAGSTGGAVTVTSNGAITVDTATAAGSVPGGYGTGILAQSIGGGGGNAGFNIAGAGTNAGAPLTLGIGGSGAAGGAASAVTVNRGLTDTSLIRVTGDNAAGIFAQSVGGGGGNANGNLLLSGSLKAKFDIQLAIGGAGGGGGDGGAVTVDHRGDISLAGLNSRAIMAQSIGGGGGNAAVNINASLVGNRAGEGSQRPGTKTLDLQIGGGTGAGADGGAVLVDHNGSLTTLGNGSIAVFAQSIGGGGGNAAENYSQNFNDAGQISVAIGRIGGTGGLGGAVEVIAAGLIETSGFESHGIHAQSIGGGGGNSQTTTVSVEGDRESQAEGSKESASMAMNLEFALGLEGGIGSASGIVDVTNNGWIETSGKSAHGIYAQSIGGGGGNGGAAIIDRFSEIPLPLPGDESADSEYSVAVQIGGRGGSGSFGGAVNVANTGTILTFGEAANAVSAQSIGGGGGNAGAAFNVETPGKGNSISLAFALGGAGGPGSDGGAVAVDNLGILQTSGDNAAAILAQSIGGGGGNAGLAGSFSVLAPQGTNTATVIGFNMGGTGGTGGAGGAVRVANGSAEIVAASILTLGTAAHGIHAQSLGGGGGNGGATLSGNFATSSNAYQLAVNIGGEGGSGGIGGTTLVDNFGSIETRGDEAHGIFAQSIGGGGGNGGLSLSFGNLYASRAFPRQALIAVGGSGGDGNDAGTVTVNNNGSITTSGRMAHGIFAQSLGGGGGNMALGLGLTFDPTVNAGVNFLANTAAFLLGAADSEGGLGGAVTINQFGDITVSGEGAEAVRGQSINGGGGGLTLDLSGIAGFLAGDLLPGFIDIEPVVDFLSDFVSEPPSLTLFGGAEGAGDANAELVTINMIGTARVLGDNGAGLNLASIGGGGGRFDLAASFTDIADARAVALPVTAGLGGRDSSNVNGGTITSSQTGDAITQGFNTPAVLLQSVGGGGGRSILDFTGLPGQIGDILLSLGGSGLTNAAGGSISHTQAGTVATLGANSVGVFAQSVGGGGGITQFSFTAPEAPATAARTMAAITAASAPAGPPASLVLGGAGGTELGGNTIVIVQTGDVMSAAENSPGLLLQSIGAGGGYIAVDGVGLIDVTLGGSGGASGAGGAVILTLDGMVVTEGSGSHGIVLQSIGGGGGAVSGAGPDTQVVLSAANSGDGGSVDLALTGDIVIDGSGASAIIAQSLGGGGGLIGSTFAGTAGGAGAGGAITLLIDGDVSVMAPGETAILAQSLGGNGGGNIELELAAGHTIFVGEGGLAVAFDGGADNLFVNRGTISSPDGLDMLLMTGTSGNDRIENHGQLTGNVALGGGTNALANLAGGTLLTGSSIDLGSGASLFSNAGLLAPGGTDTIVQTQVVGGFSQLAGGQAFLEVDLLDDSHDAINATGTAVIGGGVDVRLLNSSDFQPGLKAYRIFTGDGGASLAGPDLRADSSVVLNLLGISASGDAVLLNYDMTFAPVTATGNQSAVGLYLDRVQTAGVPGALAPTFDQLIAEQDAAVYSDLLTQLGADFYGQQDTLAIGLSQDFAQRMVNCGTNGFATGGGEGTICAWAQGSMADTTIDPQAGSPGSSSDILSFSAGAHYAVGQNLSLAIAVGYDDLDMFGYGGAWAANGSARQIGLGTVYHWGSTRIGAYLSYGEASFDTTRVLAGFGSSASSSRNVTMLGAQLAISHEFDLGGFSVLPQLSGGITSLGGGDTTETGANPNDLVLSQSSGTFGWVMPELRLGYTAPLSGKWSIRPYVAGALRYYLSGDPVSVDARFAADTTGIDPFSALTPLDRSHLTGEAGIEVFNLRGVTISGSYRLERSSNWNSEGARINLMVPF